MADAPAQEPNGTSNRPSSRLAIRSPLAVAVFLAVIIAAGAADLLTKHYVFRSFLDNPQLSAAVREISHPRMTTRMILHDERVAGLLRKQVAPGVQFTISTNPGIAFGTRWLPRWLVSLATVVTVLAVMVYFAISPSQDWLGHVGLGLIVGGALGNLYDRLCSVVSVGVSGIEPIRGEVRDFIDCSGLFWPYVFNVADAWLVIGVGLLMIVWFRQGKKHPARKRPA